MTDKPTNWMDQAGSLFKQWTDQQQALLRAMSVGGGPFGIGGTPTVNAPADVSEGLRKAQALWQSSMEQWVSLAQKALPQSGITGESLKTLFDPSQWAQAGLGPLDAAIEHLVEGPSYATLWTLDRKILKAQKLRAEWAKDLAAYQVLMHGAWNEAVKRFLVAINDAQGTPITSWRELTDVWIDIANDTLVETHRTPEFLEAQRRLTRSGVECRLQEREIAEAFCEIQQMPTRTEMDEVQREVYELRRRLRALERSGIAAVEPATRSPSAAKKPGRDSGRASPNSAT
jgi:polyhydroxyalkanoate synthesis regulator phasin